MSDSQIWKITTADDKASVTIVDEMIVFDQSSDVVNVLGGRGMQGRKSIPIRNITSVQVKRAGFLSPGYINFSYVGGKEFKGGLMEATRDPNTLLFNTERNDAVEAFAAEVERLRSLSQNSSTATTGTLADELTKLATLWKSGVLTEAEFVAAKQKLLGH
jgi:hypothetical protein